MLSNLEALIALAERGTMTKAALALHITQSAVSKRIDSLELELGYAMIEKVGRKVRLTPSALYMLERVRPLITQLKEEIAAKQLDSGGRLSISVAVSVLLSGGAKALAEAAGQISGLELQVNALHSSFAVECVRSGESMLALVHGTGDSSPDLRAYLVTEQQMVIVPSGLKKISIPATGVFEVLSMGDHTEAWRFTQKGIKACYPSGRLRFEKKAELESFSAITEMARAGFGHGIVPLGVALALGVSRRSLLFFPGEGVKIPISVIGRSSTLARPVVEKFCQQLASAFRK